MLCLGFATQETSRCSEPRNLFLKANNILLLRLLNSHWSTHTLKFASSIHPNNYVVTNSGLKLMNNLFVLSRQTHQLVIRKDHGREKDFFRGANSGYFHGGQKHFFRGGKGWWNFILTTLKLRKKHFCAERLVAKWQISKSKGCLSPPSDADRKDERSSLLYFTFLTSHEKPNWCIFCVHLWLDSNANCLKFRWKH